MASSILWLDKYRPTTFDKLDLHSHLTEQLKKLSEAGDFPHLLFYGPSGAGKKTRILALLRHFYGPSVEKIKLEQKTIEIPNQSKTIELATVSSSYHIEMTPSDCGYYDRFVIQVTIKEIAQNRPMDGKKTFKVVVLNEVDKLTKGAQHALRRTMEKYMSSCRLILCCNSSTKVIEPLRSRCLSLRIPAPSVDEIVGVLSNICKKEKISLPNSLAQTIAQQSERNLRKAILMLEATKVKNQLNPNQTVEKTDWEDFIIQLAKEIAEEQSPQRLMLVRGKIYDLLSHCIPAEIIIKNLTLELLKKCDSELKVEVIKWAAYYEQRLQQGNKDIFHIEAFVAKFMAIYKKFLVQLGDY